MKKRMKMKTTSGMTMIDLDKVSAYTINKMVEHSLYYTIDIHMDNSTIFTAALTEAERTIFENKWGDLE